ncbi:MAG: helix-hairpin-helix domain-containing protein [Prevotellaceae bacterium]|jgi:hypothetical protein|nr:helix-hairpin-helix domain-containing protein [Prevotellaceae bacterium]
MKRTVTIWLLFAGSIAGAQTPDDELPDLIRQLVETLAGSDEDADADVDLQALYETCEALLEEPLNLNTATESDLQQLQLLTDFQIQSLLEYRTYYGKLYSVYELPLILGFNEEIAAQLAPFITVVAERDERPPTFTDRLTRGRHQILARTGRVLEQQQGYRPISAAEQEAAPNARYLGAPWALYTRYRYTFKNKMQWAFSAKNDAGEPFFAGANRQGFDFYSAHVQIADVGIVERLIVGDYQMQFGQGLAAWGGYSLSKAADALNIKRHERGLTGYTSSNETMFRRGVALTLQHRSWKASAFVSYKNIDASADSSEFVAFQTTGQHNTLSRMAGKQAVSETLAGTNISYRFEHFHIGMTALWYRYGKDYNRAVKPYNRFELSEPQNANIGIDFYGVWPRVSVFGEGALSANGGWAALAGALFNIDPALCLSLLYRNYSRHYQAMYAQGFGETGHVANENGFYAGLRWFPLPDITVSAYADAYRFPWMRYRAYAPSHGFEYRAQIDYRPGNTLGMYLLIKQEQKQENNPDAAAAITPLQPVDALRIRYEITYELLAGLSMRNRLEWTRYRAAARETGLLLYHDIRYAFAKWPLSASLRFAVFDTDSWNTRLYAYEHDMLYAFSVPAYYSRGARWYLNLHIKTPARIDLWFRIAQTRFIHTDSISDGLTKIDGTHQTTAKIQLSVKF